MTHVSKTKPDRHRIDLSDDSLARHWTKRLGHSREDIAAAVAKVGDNCETVRKELGVNENVCTPRPADVAVKAAS